MTVFQDKIEYLTMEYLEWALMICCMIEDMQELQELPISFKTQKDN